MDIAEILQSAVTNGASDIYIVAGRPVSYRKAEQIAQASDTPLSPAETEEAVSQIYKMAGNRDMTSYLDTGDDDFSFTIPSLSRFRVSAYKQRSSLAAVIRVITFDLPDPKQLMLPDVLIELGNYTKGMVLVTGPAGSGKSTSLASIINHINMSRQAHIITLEDPLEFLHRHNKSIISQREIHSDTDSYVTALRAALRQGPDVILLGEMRDYETMAVAMTAAETGHLLLSTLHTIGAANTINRIIDVFPANQQRQIAVQLSTVLNVVVSQQLVPTIDGRLVPAFEVMTVTPAIRNMIRDNKIHQIDGVISSSISRNMFSMDSSLLNLYNQKLISKETALVYATNPEMMERKLH